MDAIATILQAMRLTGGIFLDAEFSAPWCVSARVGPEDCGEYGPVPRSIIAFHYVSAGTLQLQVASEPPLTVQAGEIVVLPRNDGHVLGSHLDREPVAADHLIEAGADGRLALIRHGGGGDKTSIICGFLGSDRDNDPVLLMLPRVLTLKIEEDASAAWVESSFRFAASTSPAAGPGQTPEMLARLAELLFMDTVRRYLETLSSEQSRWCSGLLDTQVAQALSLLHSRMQQRWTTEELALQVGLSRSAFAERFTRAMGEAPMRYLAQERLRVAARHLTESKDSLARIAFAVGYESEAAFNRAFRREFGMPPATWRNRQRSE